MLHNARNKTIQSARDIIALDPIYLDTETTGVGPRAEIVEICIIDELSRILINKLIKPTRPIPPDATRIHGITNTDIQNAPGWNSVWSEVQNIIAGRLVAVYNADFDKRMLQQSNRMHNIPWMLPSGTRFFCIMKLYAQFYGDWNPTYRNYRWHSLEAAGEQSNITFKNSHRAYEDTFLAKTLLHYISAQ